MIRPKLWEEERNLPFHFIYLHIHSSRSVVIPPPSFLFLFSMVLPVSHRVYRGVANDRFEISCPPDRKNTVLMANIARWLIRLNKLKVTQEATM